LSLLARGFGEPKITRKDLREGKIRCGAPSDPARARVDLRHSGTRQESQRPPIRGTGALARQAAIVYRAALAEKAQPIWLGIGGTHRSASIRQDVDWMPTRAMRHNGFECAGYLPSPFSLPERRLQSILPDHLMDD